MDDASNSSLTFQKILGLIILILGLAMIFYAVYASYNIFTGKSQPPDIFKTVQKAVSQSQNTLSSQEQAQKLIQESIQQQIGTMLPADTLPKISNLLSWSLFAWILIFAGVQVSGIGIRLLKK